MSSDSSGKDGQDADRASGTRRFEVYLAYADHEYGESPFDADEDAEYFDIDGVDSQEDAIAEAKDRADYAVDYVSSALEVR